MPNKRPIRNVEFLMAKQSFLKRFEKLLTDLQNFSINGHFKQKIQRFRSCLKPNEAQNVTQLPHFSTDDMSRKADKDTCALCTLSFTIQVYWVFCNGGLNQEDRVNTLLTKLEGYAKYGRKAFIVAGRFPKFYLERV